MCFSVVIPLYNKEKHIKKSISSVLRQTYSNFELIVVDDGSTDLSATIVEGIKDERIKLLKKSNGGVSSARNYGINHANNEYIAFLDADDEWKPNYLQEIKNMIEKFPNAGAYATLYKFKRGKNSYLPKLNINLKENESSLLDYFKGSLYQPLISASSVTIPKKVFEHIGFFSEELNKGEDLEMWCRIALKYDVAFKNKVLAIYHLDAENRSNVAPTDFSKTFMSRVETILEREINSGNDSIYFREYMISRILPKARYLINNNRGKEARQLLYKYKDTKYYKKSFIKTYIISFNTIRFFMRTILK